MIVPRIGALALAMIIACVILPAVRASNVTALTGTWTTKSAKVFTGPGFYDPVDELLIEPGLPGISISFTDDGFWETAIYSVSSNPTTPKCPTAVLQFQHGTYTVASNGSLLLTPFSVDGRQLLSDPCSSTESVYSRYDQFLVYSQWDVDIDDYHGRYRLKLYAFDGTPVNPMFLAYRPPLMLPTVTLNPTETAKSATESSATSTSESVKKRIRRSFENKSKTTAIRNPVIDANLWWWIGMSMMVGGGSAFLFLERKRFKVKAAS
ncbi:chaperone for protein-folding within the ER, fungal-domain-containing protein [Lipomyces japonicus]|uniref:chaperone for protein-folding within the ER, fungal-domain-containing protein n=1 Tax=Lipomyces japonicus TaxID=56871 RepID=UPI0034CEC598